MGEEQFDRVQRLFLGTLELSEDRREWWLLQQCGDDRGLLEEVRTLLDHDSPGNDPLEDPIDQVIADVSGIAKRELGEPKANPVDRTNESALFASGVSSNSSKGSSVWRQFNRLKQQATR